MLRLLFIKFAERLYLVHFLFFRRKIFEEDGVVEFRIIDVRHKRSLRRSLFQAADASLAIGFLCVTLFVLSYVFSVTVFDIGQSARLTILVMILVFTLFAPISFLDTSGAVYSGLGFAQDIQLRKDLGTSLYLVKVGVSGVISTRWDKVLSLH